jgi:hypothetical protein
MMKSACSLCAVCIVACNSLRAGEIAITQSDDCQSYAATAHKRIGMASRPHHPDFSIASRTGREQVANPFNCQSAMNRAADRPQISQIDADETREMEHNL